MCRPNIHLRQFLEYRQTFRRLTTVLFIETKAEFDSVDSEVLRQCLTLKGVPKNYSKREQGFYFTNSYFLESDLRCLIFSITTDTANNSTTLGFGLTISSLCNKVCQLELMHIRTRFYVETG